jgi:hypothetical protein
VLPCARHFAEKRNSALSGLDMTGERCCWQHQNQWHPWVCALLPPTCQTKTECATHSLSYFHVFHIIKTGHDAQSSSFKPAMGLQPKIWDTQKWASLLNNWNWWISSRSPSGLDFDPHLSWFTCHIGGPSRQPQAATCHCSGVRSSSLLWLLRLFVRLSLHIHMSSCINTHACY